ncbi:MAG: E3 binding domain-containing protein, partial [Candidatus Nanopelagicales bacterium]|nr:E3 binding domain-containing protein [Candidatus Nanopelagicales bacterium]
MSVSVKMPQLGESVTEGTVTRWLKAVGDTVVADEPLLEVSTDKVDTEIPAPASGILLSISAGEDEVVLVGAELAVIGESAEAAAPAPAPAQPAAPEPTPAPIVEPVAAPIAAPAAAPAPTPAPSASGSSTSIVLPALGESVTEGTVTRWLKAVGDTVAVDEPLVEVSTDKVDTEIPSPVAGVLLSIAVAEDSVVAVGGELAVVGTSAGAPAPTPPAAAPVAPAAVTPAAAVPAATAPAPAAASDAYVTPLVRRLATQNNVDLATVVGTGIGGRIRKSDVLAAAGVSTPSAA